MRKIYILKNIYFFLFCVCMCTRCFPGVHRCQQRKLDSLGLMSQVVASHCVGARKQMETSAGAASTVTSWVILPARTMWFCSCQLHSINLYISTSFFWLSLCIIENKIVMTSILPSNCLLPFLVLSGFVLFNFSFIVIFMFFNF